MANVLALAVVLIVIAAGENAGMARAQSPPPSSSSSSCSVSLVSLVPCVTFVKEGANDSRPTQGCCTALAPVVSTSPTCLCELFNADKNALGISINQTRALALPGACKITSPPLSECKSPAVSNPPAAAPSFLPPATSGVLSPSGSHEGPTASTNGGSILGESMLIHVVGIMGSLTYIISASSI